MTRSEYSTSVGRFLAHDWEFLCCPYRENIPQIDHRSVNTCRDSPGQGKEDQLRHAPPTMRSRTNRSRKTELPCFLSTKPTDHTMMSKLTVIAATPVSRKLGISVNASSVP